MGRKSSKKSSSRRAASSATNTAGAATKPATKAADDGGAAADAAVAQTRRKLTIPAALLLLLSIGSATYLTYLWIQVRSVAPGAKVTSFCTVSKAVDCVTVAESKWSTVAGVPTSVIGLEFFLLALGLLVLSRTEKLGVRAWDSLLFAMMLLGLPVSGYYAYISAVHVKSLCLLCSAMYGVNLLLLVLFGVAHGSRLRAFAGEGLAELGKRLKASNKLQAGAVLLFGVFLSQFIWLPPMLPKLKSKPDAKHRAALVKHDPWGKLPRDKLTIGKLDSKITIEEFSDFQCPACQQMHEVVVGVMKKLGSRVKLVHRDYPLDPACNRLIKRSFHEHACTAAYYARCAGQQGKFWHYASVLFANQDALTPHNLEEYAKALGLDLPKLKACVARDATRQVVVQDVEEGIRRKLRGTPTFFLNGVELKGNLTDVAVWKRAIDKALGSKRSAQ